MCDCIIDANSVLIKSFMYFMKCKLCTVVHCFFLQWLRALPSSRQSFNMVFGECPYCSKVRHNVLLNDICMKCSVLSIAQGKQDIRNLQVNKLIGRSVVLHGRLLVRIKFVVFNLSLQGLHSLKKSLEIS